MEQSDEFVDEKMSSSPSTASATIPTSTTPQSPTSQITQSAFTTTTTLLSTAPTTTSSTPLSTPSLASLSPTFFHSPNPTPLSPPSPTDLFLHPTTTTTPPTTLPITGTSPSSIRNLSDSITRLESTQPLPPHPQTSPLQTSLTTLLLTPPSPFSTPQSALTSLQTLGSTTPRRVCQHPFRKNDIVWVCRTCQSDETCVLCHDCYTRSNHDGHDVAFYHAQAGGCCDCGDPDAWNPDGFCDRHGCLESGGVEDGVARRAEGVVRGGMDWLVGVVCEGEEGGGMEGRRVKSMEDLGVLEQGRVGGEEEEDGGLRRSKLLHGSMVRGWGAFVPSSGSVVPAAPKRSQSSLSSNSKSPAQLLGEKGRREEGLFLVLHNDEIHSASEIAMTLSELYNGFSRETQLSKIIRLLRLHGDLILFGTAELVNEIGPVVSSCWKDGDGIATTRVGQLMLEKKEVLTRAKLVCSIKTRKQLILEERAIVVIEFMSTLARSCDVLCQVVARAMNCQNHLIPMLRSDLKMTKKITSAWHALLLTLLAVPSFKANLAGAYCDIYSVVTKEYASGVGVLDCSLFTLSVQFLNRQTYVKELAETRRLLERLVKSLLNMLRISVQNNILNPMHPVLTHRRYSPCISDLKCVLNVKGMARVFCAGTEHQQCLKDWIEALSLCQGMDRQVWRSWSQGHVETEPRGWVGAFNASISLGSLYERILAWEDTDMSPIRLRTSLLTCAEITQLVFLGLHAWQKKVMPTYAHTTNTSTLPAHARTPASLPSATVSSKRGFPLALSSLPISQVTPWSFHYPLHRFAAACLREVTRRPSGLSTLSALVSTLTPQQQHSLSRGMMEFPLLVLSRAAQIRAGLWKRNGFGMQDQVLNYAEPPFCRALRDADLLLLQYSLLSHPESTATFVNLSLHRFGIFDFTGFAKAPNSDFARYRREIDEGLYPGEDTAYKNEHVDLYSLPPLALPWTYTPARGDASSSLTLLEEMLHLFIILITELPTAPSPDITPDAKARLRREVIHRLASGPRTHSELVEVHHVLPQRDNASLSEEGKLINPDDATGAALETTLAEVADLKPSKNFGPNQWVLKKQVWAEYDPAFFHSSLRCHESAAEARPTVASQPYAPLFPLRENGDFERLRRDLVCDAAVVALLYRVLHVHLSGSIGDAVDLRGKNAYEKDALSETALSRTIHMITLGIYSFQNDSTLSWPASGGGNPGSIFRDRHDPDSPPTIRDYIRKTLLASPAFLADCEWYSTSECGLLLLRKLALEGGGRCGMFSAQDSALKEGAKWICEMCIRYSPEAKAVLGGEERLLARHPPQKPDGTHVDFEKRRKEAKQRAMKMMMANAKKFAATIHDEEEEEEQKQLEEQWNFDDSNNGGSGTPSVSSIVARQKHIGTLLKERPQCIICVDDESRPEKEGTERMEEEDVVSPSGISSNKGGMNNALAFCGHAQASTVLKGGGGPPSTLPPLDRFVGTNVALCGHAVHASCCDSYLASVAQRDGVDRLEGGKKGEFRCPLCQRLSNVLIPFIDVGMDWIDRPTVEPMEVDGGVMMTMMTLGRWIRETNWDDDTGWDGRCTFASYARQTSSTEDDVEEQPPAKHPPVVIRRPTLVRSGSETFRSFGKKDLVAAWNAVMKTPRFRRKPSMESDSSGIKHQKPTSTSSTGVTELWRRLMDQLSDVGHRADWKRLGEEELMKDYGEFRHYLVEKSVYNAGNRLEGREIVEWPMCISRNLTDSQRNELSREKLISKLLLSIQSFTYSCCAEISDIRRISKKQCSSYHSKFGISSVSSSTSLIHLPPPIDTTTDSEEEDGTQIFEGRLGKLRFFGLSVMAATGAVSKEIAFLAFFSRKEKRSLLGLRAPIAFPVLVGHVLTHVVAAMCATCGKGRLKSNLLEGDDNDSSCEDEEEDLRRRGGRSSQDVSSSSLSLGEVVIYDCENFVKLGVLARMMQVLLGSLGVLEEEEGRGGEVARKVLDMVEFVSNDAVDEENRSNGGWTDDDWKRGCCELIRIALSRSSNNFKIASKESTAAASNQELLDRFAEACQTARTEVMSFLANCGTILQILVPGTTMEGRREVGESDLEKLATWWRMEPLKMMLECPPVRDLIAGWYEDSLPREEEEDNSMEDGDGDDVTRSELRKKLDCKRVCRVSDWPVAASESMEDILTELETKRGADSLSATATTGSIHHGMLSSNRTPRRTSSSSPRRIDLPSPSGRMERQGSFSSTSSNPPVHSSKKCVPLLGGCRPERAVSSAATIIDRPRIKVLPTSYTDLYAELSVLCPDSEQTALCLVCGEVLNAGGKSECTKHAVKCGAGCGIFFLLQECLCLIMHGGKAAYVHSPYVDSHGETPQYRGRPLNLDLDRYDSLKEMWAGHLVRERVIAERSSSRQVIIANFY